MESYKPVTLTLTPDSSACSSYHVVTEHLCPHSCPPQRHPWHAASHPKPRAASCGVNKAGQSQRPNLSFPPHSRPMDTDASLLPTALFSPSKARQQRAQAQEWAHVDAWLASKHPGRNVPYFERNDDTLKTLLALAAANERADDEAALVEAVEREALRELRQGQLEPARRTTGDCRLQSSE